MAKWETEVVRDFDELLKIIQSGMLNGSISASLEGSSDFWGENSRCSVRVFERYSAMGGNRVSLNLTLFQSGDEPIKLSAIASGGSQAMFIKVNTFGEEAFLNGLQKILKYA